jgi:hypothetical protein
MLTEVHSFGLSILEDLLNNLAHRSLANIFVERLIWETDV